MHFQVVLARTYVPRACTHACCCARRRPQDEPEALRAQLEALLGSLGVAYSYSKTSKFANFVNRTLL